MDVNCEKTGLRVVPTSRFKSREHGANRYLKKNMPLAAIAAGIKDHGLRYPTRVIVPTT